MPVAERFVSVNGEGVRAGRLASFVRFAGCNLRCSYCDTMWANEPGCHVEDLRVEDIAAWVAAQPAACTTLTGGEPALQPQRKERGDLRATGRKRADGESEPGTAQPRLP